MLLPYDQPTPSTEARLLVFANGFPIELEDASVFASIDDPEYQLTADFIHDGQALLTFVSIPSSYAARPLRIVFFVDVNDDNFCDPSVDLVASAQITPATSRDFLVADLFIDETEPGACP